MIIESVTAPVWADAAHTSINCRIKFEGLVEAIAYTATRDDTEAHGRELFADLVAGKYGKIGKFAVDIEVLKAGKLAALTDDYHAACQHSVSFTTKEGITRLFQADTASQSLVQASLAGLSGLQHTPPGFAWIAQDNTPVPFTWTDLQGLGQVMYLQGYQAFVNLQMKKAQLAAAVTEDDVNAVVW